MIYLLNKNGRYYFQRRIPLEFKEYDPRSKVRFSLNTSCKKAAQKQALLQNSKLEEYWHSLASSGQKHVHSSYQTVVDHARLYGYAYISNSKLADSPLNEILERIDLLIKGNFNANQVNAVLGGTETPVIRIDDALTRYWDFAKDKLINKSPNQIRKFKAPRLLAVNNFITAVGNKVITELARNDILKFRDWWIERIQSEKLSADSANKNFIHLKTIIEVVSENLGLNIDIKFLFNKIVLKDRFGQTRLPFETKFLQDVFLDHQALAGLPVQAKWVLFAMAETGCRLTELCGLLPSDIYLDADIPYIHICDRIEKPLKTPHSDRTIPLTGYALDCFKACPEGFTDYYDRPDALSSILNRYLRERNLLPSPNHSVYSLRHSFQDRILEVNAPDRVQAELMGHKFNRPKYGSGASLAQKLGWMEKIQLKQAESIGP